MTEECSKCGRQVGLHSNTGRKSRHFCVPMERWRDFPENPTHRYGLSRRWGFGPYAVWVLANPSTADGTVDDPTIAEVCRFTADIVGLKAVIVLNLYSKRSTRPTALKNMDDLIGSSDEHIEGVMAGAEICIVGWGTCLVRHRDVPFAERTDQIRGLVPATIPVSCLGRNEATKVSRVATPWHPLHAARQRPRPVTLEEWNWG
jgi:hypothetical protein